ncbi:alanine racemase [Alteromonas aestuariivivens]|uniref:Alanine racemase n=1 Tax=Alteromonas aestuariivivens TaxID=1938339 RepID=A0A3D8M9H8_9ALTE|nr:alanine racemase [Alteromonas aestuariivivens]RDV26629.1 alanine racemase [Alteromonas aestuariivivens]
MSRQTQAIIHADAIIDNYKALSALAPTSKTMAVIKADAYGHGAVNVARLLRGQCGQFAVAIIEEALALREAGITAPIVVLEGPHQDRECQLAAQHNCILVAHTEQQLAWLARCPSSQRPVVWLKVDTGMHRLGFEPGQVLPMLDKYAPVFSSQTVLTTHFASADDPDNPFTREQLLRFSLLREQTGLAVSMANSPATVGWPASHGDWNRVGIAMYGGEPLVKPVDGAPELRPAMTLRSSVMAVRNVASGESVGYGQAWRATRPSRIATVAIGYADGYPRHCPNGTPVAVNGQRASLAGRVSMDMITVDVTDLEPVYPGDRVELWGNTIPVDEVAHAAGTISYELLTRLSMRVPRIVKHV